MLRSGNRQPHPPGRSEAQPSRRQFLHGSAVAGAGLVIGFGCSRKGEKGRGAAATEGTAVGGEAKTFVPNAFVRVAPDSSVTIISKHIEFGQGTYTGLATILAEELDADWSQVRVEAAPADASRYANLAFGAVQGTGGSTAMANSWQQLRRAGATARAMLVAAAAAQWNVPAGEISVERGRIRHAASGRSASFGELATRAATLTPPVEVKLKDRKDFTLVGRDLLPRVDVAAKTDGSAVFTLDLYLPDMLTAVVARAPRFGATVKSFQVDGAKAVAGVTDVVQIPSGVAVVAKNFWAAKKGRDALEIQWDESAAEKRDTDKLFAQYRKLLKKPGAVAVKKGDPSGLEVAKKLSATFEFPYLAHAPMEPLDCIVKLGKDTCEVWSGSQLQTMDQMLVAGVVGMPPEKVNIHTQLAGGSFGRRATPDSDVATEAASIAKATHGKAAIKVVWTREDGIRGGRYRPLYVHGIEAGLDSTGNIVQWRHRIVGQSINRGGPFAAALIKDGIDHTSVEGAANLPYDIPSLLVDLHTTDVGVPVLWWRSVGSTHTAFSTEAFLDEIAHATEKDPVEIRRKLLAAQPRYLGVLELAAEKAKWGSPLPKGKGRGIAVHKSFDTYVAQVAEVSVAKDHLPVVERVVCAVDCGIAINPDNIRAQIEGGIGYGLGAALHNSIDLKGGRVVQSNFHDYAPLRIDEMPDVEVFIVASAQEPTGVGEPGVPPIAPAVANAYFQATGRRVRKLPFRLSAVRT